MKLTAIAIKVTRFRTFMTPCELREGKGSQSVKVADDEVKYAVKSVIREATRLHEKYIYSLELSKTFLKDINLKETFSTKCSIVI